AKSATPSSTPQSTVGCFELFAHEGIRSIGELKGKSVGVQGLEGLPHTLVTLMAAQVGLNPKTDINGPWSQYFCCLLGGNRDFVRQYPVATKRAIRAILKATDFCATEPERAARQLVDKGFTSRYDYALQTLIDNPYDKWREYDPEDTLRFYALRL